MKKQLLLLALMLPPMVEWAEAVEIDGIYYDLDSEINEATVKHNPRESYSDSVVIPASVTYEGVEYILSRFQMG